MDEGGFQTTSLFCSFSWDRDFRTVFYATVFDSLKNQFQVVYYRLERAGY